MPIYEFKCSKCNHFFEVLITRSDDSQADTCCPQCQSQSFERVLSRTSYAMGAGTTAAAVGPGVQTRNCSSGSCTTYDIPGHGD